MKNINLLLDSNKKSTSKIKLKKGIAIIKINDSFISGKTLKSIAEKINAIHEQYRKVKIPITFFFEKFEFIDKLTFVIFECICYDLIRNYGHYIQIQMKEINCDIYTAGIESSPLLLLNKTLPKSVKKYPQKFKKDFYGRHFRRVLTGENEETNYLGNLYSEIDTFLKPFNIEEKSRDKVANVITELVGNGCEHGYGDCLIDIDVAPNYEKVTNSVSDGQSYHGINIVVVNFSDRLLGDGILENILKQHRNSLNERYKTVIEAYENHKKFFSESYTEEDFCNITTFQHKISGRADEDLTGGTGLTKLIQSLEERSEAYRCYVVSGNRAVNFYKEFLEYDENKWIGFNKYKNYISKYPSNDNPTREVISEALMYLPGTAYNLNFVMKIEREGIVNYE